MLNISNVSSIYLKCKDVFGEIFDNESVFTLYKELVDRDTIDIYLKSEGKVDKVPIDNPNQPHVFSYVLFQ